LQIDNTFIFRLEARISKPGALRLTVDQQEKIRPNGVKSTYGGGEV